MTTARRASQTSIWVLPIDSGGCGACVQQMTALLGPRFADDLRARGIGIALSPRHADVVLVAGALSRAAREPVMRLLESVPQPRALVAVGDCALNGCVFRGSPMLSRSAAEELDVNVEIGGCPPAPEAILEAIGEASQILAADATDDPADEGEGPDESTDGSLEDKRADMFRAHELNREDA